MAIFEEFFTSELRINCRKHYVSFNFVWFYKFLIVYLVSWSVINVLCSHCNELVRALFWLASSEDPCTLPPVVGRCRARLQRWFYNAQTKECQLFTYGGCGGNANNFKDRKECFTRCMPKGILRVCCMDAAWRNVIIMLCMHFMVNNVYCDIYVYIVEYWHLHVRACICSL